MSNPELNFIILIIFCIGLYKSFAYFLTLDPELIWFEDFLDKKEITSKPKILLPLYEVTKNRKKVSLNSTSLQSILDILYSRIQDNKDTGRYFTNLLIFLGLLGTFLGLLITINSISGVITNFTISSSDLNLLFDMLKKDLSRPLSGMSIAFSSSLIGLSCSLILGYINHQIGRAQTEFYNYVEEKLSSLTIINSKENNNSEVSPYLISLLEQNAENLNKLELLISNTETAQSQTIKQLQELSLSFMVTAKRLETSSNIETDLKIMKNQLSNDIKILSKSIKNNGKKK
jgi:hypothetical protein